MRGIKTIGVIAVSATILSGCIATGPSFRGGGTAPRTPSFAEGTWQDNVGTYVFGNGSFVGTDSDTGNKLSDGTYSYVGQDMIKVSIDSTNFSIKVAEDGSPIEREAILANCRQVNLNAMNCTTSSGAEFSLVRIGVVS